MEPNNAAGILAKIEVLLDRRADLPKLAYSLDEAAAAVGYSTFTLRRHADKGSLIVRYANRKPIILRSDLEAWLDSLPDEPPRR